MQVAIREALKIIQKDTALEFVTCQDGKDALDAYAKHRPDWVLMDIAMREVDGIAAARRIRSRFPKARILMLTNYDEPQLRQAAGEAGASGYVMKDNLMKIKEFIDGK